MAEIKGSCRCGKVSYASSADPIFVGVCHCRTCQKSTGSAYATVVGVPTASMTVSGITTRFDGLGDSGQATHRDFCPACGATVTQSVDALAGITLIPAGTLDDPSGVQPARQIYCDSALTWAVIADLERFPKIVPHPLYDFWDSNRYGEAPAVNGSRDNRCSRGGNARLPQSGRSHRRQDRPIPTLARARSRPSA
jgi:hypothetical protein